MKILLIEKSSLIKERVRDLLVDLDQVEAVMYAASYDEAVRIADSSTPDVCILDINVSENSGIDLVRYMRNKLADSLIILLTDYAYPQLKEKCIKAGSDYCLNIADEFLKIKQIVTEYAADSATSSGGVNYA